jgi:hypothetical protein
MKWKSLDRRVRLKLIGALILSVGFGSAFFIYRAAVNIAKDTLGYEEGSGAAFQIRPEYTKKYVHDMELYGGKANLVLDKFMREFAGLWQGKSLAFTVAFLAVFASLVIFYIAHHLPSGSESHSRSENPQSKTG